MDKKEFEKLKKIIDNLDYGELTIHKNNGKITHLKKKESIKLNK